MTKVYKIFLDDIRVPTDIYPKDKNEDWVVVRNLTDFKNTINTLGVPIFISFDHDISDFDKDTNEEYTGLTCAKFLVDYCIDNICVLCDFKVHSSNPCGSENINGLLNGFKKFQTFT